jgi:hypothetical protein
MRTLVRAILLLILLTHQASVLVAGPADTCCGVQSHGECSSDCANPVPSCVCYGDRNPATPPVLPLLPGSIVTVSVLSIPSYALVSPEPTEILHVPRSV